MIAKITGKIDELKPTEIILNVNGIGYGLSIPLSTYEKIQSCSEVTLYVFTLHREDQFRLFGFFSEEEKKLFSILLGISGIGPAMAISILSGITIGRLLDAVQQEDTALLTKIPGIGKAKADKLIFELKRKQKKLAQFTGRDRAVHIINNDAVEALVSLGFDEGKSVRAVEDLMKNQPDAPIESIIKEALKALSV